MSEAHKSTIKLLNNFWKSRVPRFIPSENILNLMKPELQESIKKYSEINKYMKMLCCLHYANKYQDSGDQGGVVYKGLRNSIYESGVNW